MNNIIHTYHQHTALLQGRKGGEVLGLGLGVTFDGVFEGVWLGYVFDDCEGDFVCRGFLGVFFEEVVCFGLGADGAADGVTFLEELGEDVGADEAAWSGYEDEGCHVFGIEYN